MARIRSIKPDFFRHAGLYDAEKSSGLPLRLAFAGLWTAADREGRFRWQPRALKLDCLPYDECDFGLVLEALAASGFISQYEIAGESFGCIPGWKHHQVINNRESESKIPPPDACPTRDSPINDVTVPTSAAVDSPGYVYVALAEAAGRAKIGYSQRDPVARLHDLSCGSPEDLVLVGYFEGSQADEAELRRAVKAHFLRREWVRWSPDVWLEISNWVTGNGRVTHAWGTRHCNFKGEGKGREGKEKDADAARSAPEVVSSSPEVDFYRRIKEIVGPSAGGLGKRLLTAKDGNVALARAAVEQASTKQDPREYLGAIVRTREGETKNQWAF